MRIKTVKYSKNGLTRAENTVPKFIMPKNDLTSDNIQITTTNHYIKITKKKK